MESHPDVKSTIIEAAGVLCRLSTEDVKKLLEVSGIDYSKSLSNCQTEEQKRVNLCVLLLRQLEK